MFEYCQKITDLNYFLFIGKDFKNLLVDRKLFVICTNLILLKKC